MLKIENAEVIGWEHAIRGMRNPKNSWEKSDSLIIDCDGECSSCDAYELGSDDYCTLPLGENIVIGPNDRKLMTQLAKAGTDHRKFMRMITVYLDITAPLYWWKEFDTYKVGTVANSCSTMHKIAEKEFDVNDFSHEHIEELDGDEYNMSYDWLLRTVDILNYYRKKYNAASEKLKGYYKCRKKACTCSAKAFLVADDSASSVKLQPEAYCHAELRGAGEHL